MIETKVVSLYIHGDRSSRPEDSEPTPMLALATVEVVEGRGIRQDRRYFRPANLGHERKRQVSLIDEGTIWRLEEQFGPLDRSLIKSQIVLAGDVHLPSLLGATLRFPSGAELTILLEREPCFAMDLIYPSLREAMRDGQQGALAVVTAGGAIATGDAVRLVTANELATLR